MFEGILCERGSKARVAKRVRSRGLSLYKGSQEHLVSPPLFFSFEVRSSFLTTTVLELRLLLPQLLKY